MSEKLQRLLRIVGLIQTGRHNIVSLSNICRVEERTIYRDLNLLRRSGIPVTYDRNRQRYAILEGFTPIVQKNAFSVDEAVALLSLCFGVNGKAIVPLMELAQNASAKIVDFLPRTAKLEVKHLGTFLQIVPHENEDEETSRPVFHALFESYRRLRALRIWYEDRAGQECCTLLHPYRLVYISHAWRVIGYSTFHQEICCFRLKRIVKFKKTDTEFKPPDSFFLKYHLEKLLREESYEESSSD